MTENFGRIIIAQC